MKNNSTQKVYVYDEEITIRRRKIAMEMDKEFVQMYKNLPKFLLRLRSAWSSKFASWLISEMGDDNKVDVSSRSIREFQAWVAGEGGIEVPAERTIRDVISELIEQRILLHLNRGTYKINPSIFWQKSVEDRANHVRGLVEGGHELGPTVVVSIEEGGNSNGKLQEHSETTDTGNLEEGSGGEAVS